MVLSLTLTVVAALFFYGSGLFGLLTPLPFSILMVRRGIWAALLAAFLSIFSLVLAYDLPQAPLSFLPGMVFFPHFTVVGIRNFSLLSFFYYLWIGFSLIFIGRKVRSMERGVAVAVGSSFLLVLAAIFIFMKVQSVDLVSQGREGIIFAFQRLAELNPELSVEEGLKMVDPLIHSLWRLFPSLIISMTLMIVAINLWLLRRWASGRLFGQWGDFSLWRLKEQWIWIPILSGGGYLASFYFFPQSVIAWGFLNVLIIAATISFFQGLAIFHFFLQKRLSPLLRMAVLFFFMIFFQIVMVLLILLGLFDFWFDFRREKQVTKGGNEGRSFL
ncbi:MAG: DUF2232 domain-containing protein [Deltaproteobacteria bacterium]|nr:DUF2232 domain-containing protein [Deltaproteobacteria bacterium]